jgi:hemerythrin
MANFFEWNADKYGLHVDSMDNEHRTLIGHMNKLHALYKDGSPAALVRPALDAFVKYTVKHFADEEAHMRSIGFPAADTHAAIHRDLLARVSGHVKEFEVTGKLTDPFFSFLKMWLAGHICCIDIKYAKHTAAG